MANYSDNPFAALFPSVSDVEKFKTQIEIDEEKLIINKYLKEVLQITVEHDLTRNSDDIPNVFLEDLHDAIKGVKLLNLQTLDQALFERLMMEEPYQLTSDRKDSERGEKRILFYLYQCFVRCNKSTTTKHTMVATVKKAIINQSATFLSHSDFFPSTQSPDQLLELLQSYHSEIGHSDSLLRFMAETVDCIDEKFRLKEEEISVLEALRKSLEVFRNRLLKMSLVDRNLFIHLELLQYFIQTPVTSLAIIDFSLPSDPDKGRAYQESLLGSFLSASCLPKKSAGPYQFFQNPSQFTAQEHSITEQNLWMPLKSLSIEVSQYFYKILKQSSATKEKLLEWISKCLNANSGRSKLWNNQYQDAASESIYASDGFILNLEAVLLQLCKPFAQPKSLKLLKIQPSYSREVSEGQKGPIVLLKSLSKETCLVVNEDETFCSHPDKYNFVTELFFCTHYALHIGFKVVQEQLTKLSQDLGRIQRLYEDTVAQGGAPEMVDQVKQNMERGMTKFLSLKTALLENESLELMLNFHLATSTILVNLAISDQNEAFVAPAFPLPPLVPRQLGYVPELIIENIKDCVIFIKHFSVKTFELTGPQLEHLMTLILTFMGSPERMKNPHLRANLAEMLEALMPPKDLERNNSIFSNQAHRIRLFVNHSLASHLVSTLLHVFVSIEMTGQSVAFEQKFQYRRPMYTVLEYLWNIERHKNKMQEMAKDAEEKIDASTAPLFLRFINLLMNDAIFLLDEALSYMSQLRELQRQRDQGDWAALSAQQRHQNEANFQHMGLLARFHNVMGNETIRTLRWLTSEIKSIFCHPTLVDRIAAMLNYFLLNLVGPKQKNFRVEDKGAFEFNPKQLVADICRIYLHLGGRQDNGNPSKNAVHFCSAVSKDGRSYSPDLFDQAQTVLIKIGQLGVANEIMTVAKTIETLAKEQEKDEAILGEIPDEFLDPIMNTLMVEPVQLPSSGMCIDRATISRHLLSDQTDPFNRTPLSMEMVEPNAELQTKIQNWLKQQRES